MDLFEHNLAAAKKRLLEGAEKGVECPCCGQYVKLYRRKLNSQMALFLIRLYRITERAGTEYHHVRDFLDAGHKASSDGTYLRHWGYIEPLPKADAPEADTEKKKQRTSGYWKITAQGKCFVEGLIEAPAAILMQSGKFRGYDEEKVGIKDALGVKFDYEELMGVTDFARPVKVPAGMLKSDPSLVEKARQAGREFADLPELHALDAAMNAGDEDDG